jgi:hypothetical protein
MARGLVDGSDFHIDDVPVSFESAVGATFLEVSHIIQQSLKHRLILTAQLKLPEE